MKRITYLLSAVLLVFVLAACEQQEVQPDVMIQDELAKMNNGKEVMNFRAHLSGDNEVPPVETNATGQAIFQLKDGVLHYKLIVANIVDVRMAHIHYAPAGSNGPVVVWLYPSGPPPLVIPGKFNGVLAEGTITDSNLVGPLTGMTLDDLIEKMMDGQTYVNVHTVGYGGGEVRGQIF